MQIPDWINDRVYIPARGDYALTWILGPALCFVLSLFALPAGKPIVLDTKDTAVWVNIAGFIAVLALDANLLWLHVRTQFLTWRTARKPFIGTFLTLTIFYLGMFGLVVISRGKGEVSLSGADPVFTTRCLLLGAAAIYAVLLVSALWKLDEPGLGTVVQQRARTLPLLRQLMEKRVTREQYRGLVAALKSLSESAAKLATQLSRRIDLQLCDMWEEASRELHEALKERTAEDYEANQVQLESIVSYWQSRLTANHPESV